MKINRTQGGVVEGTIFVAAWGAKIVRGNEYSAPQRASVASNFSSGSSQLLGANSPSSQSDPQLSTASYCFVSSGCIDFSKNSFCSRGVIVSALIARIAVAR